MRSWGRGHFVLFVVSVCLFVPSRSQAAYSWDPAFDPNGQVSPQVHNHWIQGTHINCGSNAPILFRLNDTNITWAPDHFSTSGALMNAPRAASAPLGTKAAAAAGAAAASLGGKAGAANVSLEGQVSGEGLMSSSSALIGPAQLFNSARVFTDSKSTNSSYAIPVNSTGYHFVRLFFDNFIFANPSVSPFNVFIEGAKVLTDFSPWSESAPVMTEFYVPVLDGTLNITFEASGVGYPFINGISVLKAPEGMYNLATGSSILLATEYRVGGAVFQPIRDEIGRIWYFDMPYSKVTDLSNLLFDPYNTQVAPGLDNFRKYANSLPDLLPFVAYAGARTANNEIIDPNNPSNFTYFIDPFILYNFPVEPSTPHRVRMGFTTDSASATGNMILDIYIDEVPVTLFYDLWNPFQRNAPVILDFDVVSNKTGALAIRVSHSSNSTNIAQQSVVSYVEIFRKMNITNETLPVNSTPAISPSSPSPSSSSSSSSSSSAADAGQSQSSNNSKLWEGFGFGVAAMGVVSLLAFGILFWVTRRRAAEAEAAAYESGKGVTEKGESWTYHEFSSKTGKQGKGDGSGQGYFASFGLKGKQSQSDDGKGSTPHTLAMLKRTGLYGTPVFSLEELREATQNFSKAAVLGQGGFGKVYLANLNGGGGEGGGVEVAVKRLDLGSQQGAREFMTELQLLSRLHHKNLVNLLGYCDEDRQLMLVYDYASNGTLKDYLRDAEKVIELPWDRRLRIAVGAARGLEYLHFGATPPVIHRDIKTSNILLDSSFNARVADFGLSKLGKKFLEDDVSNASHISTRVKGTLGYLDPVYYTKQQLTERSDVYSFGVVLLELITGRLPIWMVPDSAPSYQASGESLINLVEWALPFIESGNVGHIVAPTLDVQRHYDSLHRAALLAAECVRTMPKNRPNMAEVVRALTESRALLGAPNSSSLLDSEDSLTSSVLDSSIGIGGQSTSSEGILRTVVENGKEESEDGSFSISIIPEDE